MARNHPVLWRNLARNIAAGTRLAFFLPVRPLDFRISTADYVMLAAASLLLWLAGGWLRVGPAGALDTSALSAALAQIPLLLLACLVLARLFGDPRLLLAFAVLLVASDPAFEAVSIAAYHALQFEPLSAYEGGATLVFLAWAVAVIVRTQCLLTRWRGLRSLAGSALLLAMLVVFIWFYPRGELWVPAQEQEQTPQESVTQEELFHLQSSLLNLRLSEIAPERPDVTDLYFLALAPYGLQDTFAKELIAVRQLMEERFDTRGRSLALINHPATLRTAPIATVTNLRAALAFLGETIDVDEDVVMLHITTHGSADHRLAFDLPPLELEQLTPSALARMLADSGIKWKVIVLSACFSGGFIEPLKDENTLIVTAADATHPSFGCEYSSEFTWFSKAFYDEALRTTFSFPDAFDRARRLVAGREQAAGQASSNPQMYVGQAIRRKLAELERRLAEQDPTPRVTAAVHPAVVPAVVPAVNPAP